MTVCLATTASALVFASPDTEPPDEVPLDFPYWEHVTQRRYEGPSVIYLGAGFAITARHVGMGEIFLGGEIYAPVGGSKRTLLNTNGSAADAMIFEIEGELPDWPTLPIASEPPRPGEDVLLIGFGRGREKVVEYQVDGEIGFAFTWTRKGEKRWGTNRITSTYEILSQVNYMTRAFTFAFDEPFSRTSTRYEAQAAVGDSGGGVFVERDGRWLLAGLMVSVSGERSAPIKGSAYGDRTYAADLTHYRDEILRWTRAACSNERDDDGDERIDFPDDPGCDSPLDRNEREPGGLAGNALRTATWAGAGLALLLGMGLGVVRWRTRRQRGTRIPKSTSSESDA